MSSRCWHLSLIFVLLFKQIKKLTFAKVSSELFTMLSRWRPPPTSRPVWGLRGSEGQPSFLHLEALSGWSPSFCSLGCQLVEPVMECPEHQRPGFSPDFPQNEALGDMILASGPDVLLLSDC